MYVRIGALILILILLVDHRESSPASGWRTPRFAGSERCCGREVDAGRVVRFGSTEADFALHQRKRRIDDFATD
jgi:hypothetical protein